MVIEAGLGGMKALSDMSPCEGAPEESGDRWKRAFPDRRAGGIRVPVIQVTHISNQLKFSPINPMGQVSTDVRRNPKWCRRWLRAWKFDYIVREAQSLGSDSLV